MGKHPSVRANIVYYVSMEGLQGSAHVLAVSMGYGHERAASALRFLTRDGVIVANDYKGIPDTDRKLWGAGRGFYEWVSRFRKVPVAGTVAFGLMDKYQEIPSFYPKRDLSVPTLAVKQNYELFRRSGFMEDLITKLAKRPAPIVSTFMSPAFAAEYYNYPGDIYIVLCDADVARAWAPLEPHKTRIRFLAPTGRVAERLVMYGVPEKNISLTGFPLSPEAIGGPEAPALKASLSRRLCLLDPKGIFASQSRVLLEATFGKAFCSRIPAGGKGRVPNVAFSVGGAGAQLDIAVAAVKSLAPLLAEGKISFTLIAGTRREVADMFHEAMRKAHLSLAESMVRVVSNPDRRAYFDEFAALMSDVDILWTKPSELSFYAGLGIPVLMAPTVGSQEDFNRSWLHQVGAGVDSLDPRYTHEWLMHWIESGALARMAWMGYVNAPANGAYRIADVVMKRPAALPPLPFVV